jgi:hypothetical protein
MNTVIVLVLVLAALVLVGMWWQSTSKRRQEQQLDDARAEARRWYDRLGGQVMNLSGDDPAVKQALADAGERYNAAGAQLAQARSVHQCRLAQETAVEGLMYARAARIALGMDPGPDLPPLSAARGTGRLTEERQVEVQGETFKAGPDPSADKPYYYPGGRVQGRPVPEGWYSQPLWKPALAGAAGAIGGLVLFNMLFPPMYGGYGYDQGYDQGYDDGQADAGDTGGDAGADAGGDYAAGDFGGGDFGGDFGGGDFGGF